MAKPSKKQAKNILKKEVPGIAILVIAGLLSVTAISANQIILNQKFKALSEFSQLSSSFFDTKNYIDNNFNFSLFYPAAWQPSSLIQDQTITIKEGTDQQAQISINVHQREEKNLLDWLESRTSGENKLFILEDNAVEINGINGMQLLVQENDVLQSMVTYLPYQNFIYEIKLTYPVNQDVNYYKKTFNRIIKSFKFLS